MSSPKKIFTRRSAIRGLVFLLLLTVLSVPLWRADRPPAKEEVPVAYLPPSTQEETTLEQTTGAPTTKLIPSTTMPPSTTRAQTKRPTTTQPKKVTTTKRPQPTSVMINAPFLSQQENYPTGCESVSAVMLLKYFGVSISVDSFIDRYLPVGSLPAPDKNGVLRGPDPRKVFLGDPRSKNGWGCWSPVIEKSLRSAVNSKKFRVTRPTGLSMAQLCKKYIDNKIPVLLWATQQMQPVRQGQTWVLSGTSGESFTWRALMHCLLLVGYDANYYYFNDPLVGKQCKYPKAQVDTAYRAMGNQAVVLERR